jgi:hypothetical protein
MAVRAQHDAFRQFVSDFRPSPVDPITGDSELLASRIAMVELQDSGWIRAAAPTADSAE